MCYKIADKHKVLASTAERPLALEEGSRKQNLGVIANMLSLSCGFASLAILLTTIKCFHATIL